MTRKEQEGVVTFQKIPCIAAIPCSKASWARGDNPWQVIIPMKWCSQLFSICKLLVGTASCGKDLQFDYVLYEEAHLFASSESTTCWFHVVCPSSPSERYTELVVLFQLLHSPNSYANVSHIPSSVTSQAEKPTVHGHILPWSCSMWLLATLLLFYSILPCGWSNLHGKILLGWRKQEIWIFFFFLQWENDISICFLFFSW